MQIINVRQTILWALVTLAAATETCHALKLNITAIATRGHDSVLECWEMDTPFTIATDAGIAGSASVKLGNVTQLTYTVLPAGFDGGLHHAPAKQWVVFTTGLAVVSIPGDNSVNGTAYVSGGGFGAIFVTDTADASSHGHITRYPGITDTIALQIPTKDGRIPGHNVLHAGPCLAKDVTGLLGLATGGVA